MQILHSQSMLPLNMKRKLEIIKGYDGINLSVSGGIIAENFKEFQDIALVEPGGGALK